MLIFRHEEIYKSYSIDKFIRNNLSYLNRRYNNDYVTPTAYLKGGNTANQIEEFTKKILINIRIMMNI